MTATDHPHRTAVLDSLHAFNAGAMDDVVRQFAPDVTFTAPGHSAVAGVYRGRDGVRSFMGRLYELSGGTLTISHNEVLSDDEHLVLFLRFAGQRKGERLDCVVAGFHSDLGPDGWRQATFLPDDLAAFDRFFRGQ